MQLHIGRALVASLGLSLFATTARAQSRADSIVAGCQRGAMIEVQMKNIQADSIGVGSDRMISKTAENETNVRGLGQFFDRNRREWYRFTYDCTYDPVARRGRGRVSVDTANAVGRQGR